MNFIARDEERLKLKKAFDSDRFEAIMIYGRRRVGKSALIKQTMKDSDLTGIYYECRQTSEQSNVRNLLSAVSEQFQLPKLGFSSFEESLDYLFKISEEKKFILVLDEYPYLREKVEGSDSVLQAMIDEYQDSSKMKLVLCGSFVNVMKSLIDGDNPLYGRFHTVMELKPMNYYDAQKFYPSFSLEDKVRAYSVFGGIPYYNRQIDDRKSFHENLMNLIVAPDSILEDEVPDYIRSEIKKITNANEVFEALSRGFYRYSDIQSNSHVSSSPALAEVLKKLIDMNVVTKESPINDENNRKKTGYVISDNLSLFFYRYIYRYSSQRFIMNPEVFYQRYIQDDFENSFVPKQFEKICKEYLIRMNRQCKTDPPFEKIGKYYYDIPSEHQNGEFDVVTEDPNGYTFYVAKFRSRPISQKMIDTEIRQVIATGLNCYRYGFISRSGFENIQKNQSNLILITLKDLYE